MTDVDSPPTEPYRPERCPPGCPKCAAAYLDAKERLEADLAHWTRRMLQALDMYWMHYDGLDPTKRDPVTGAWVRHNIRSQSDGEDWWNRFEKYRARVEGLLS